jgi:hypothetical protein
MSVLGDASISDEAAQKSYLLTAPGTITGTTGNQAKATTLAPAQQYRFIQPKNYRYIPDHYKFPQYGQSRGQSNPWTDSQRRSRPVIRQGNQSGYENPWDISNLPSLGPEQYRHKPRSGGGMQQPGFGLYGQDYDRYGFGPEFRTPLDMGVPPASAAGFPFMEDMLPGLGKDDKDFPFMPFDMF